MDPKLVEALGVLGKAIQTAARAAVAEPVNYAIDDKLNPVVERVAKLEATLVAVASLVDTRIADAVNALAAAISAEKAPEAPTEPAQA